MNRKHRRWIYVIIWAIVIFLFSNQNGQESNNNNVLVVYVLNLLGIDINSIFGELTHFIIRKAAHMTEYFILYILSYRALKEDFSINKSMIYGLLITFLYASTDEFHQYFIPGRGPAFKDVLIDTGGGVLALAIVLIKHSIRKRKIDRHS